VPYIIIIASSKHWPYFTRHILDSSRKPDHRMHFPGPLALARPASPKLYHHLYIGPEEEKKTPTYIIYHVPE
jgi:hypothetical protein